MSRHCTQWSWDQWPKQRRHVVDEAGERDRLYMEHIGALTEGLPPVVLMRGAEAVTTRIEDAI